MPILVPIPPRPQIINTATVAPGITLIKGSERLTLSMANGWLILDGVEGLDDPPRALVEIEPAAGDGSIFTDSRYTAREVFFPVHMYATTTVALREKMRLLAAFTAGDLTLEVAHPDGTLRRIDGRLSRQFGQTMGAAEGRLWRMVGLALRCFDPFFYGENRSLSWVIGGEPVEFLSEEFLPIGLDNSQVLGEAVITNSGDAHAYPVWTVTGPCDSLDIEVGDTAWSVPDGLADDETLVIDGRRGVKTCEIDGTSAWGRLAAGSVIGTLPPGDTLLDGEAVGATSATTITVEWRERWLTAW